LPRMEIEIITACCICAAVLACILSGLPRAHVQRVFGFSEGIDSPKVGESFNHMQRFLPFVILRRIIVNRIRRPKLADVPRAGARLLDLGCGTGHLLRDLHDAVVSGQLPTLELHGIDLGKESIRLCKELLEKARVQDIDVREGDGAALPYTDGFMDIVVTSLSLHHWSIPGKVFDEIYRVLKPGGVLLLFDLQRDARVMWHRLIKFVTRLIVPKPLRQAREPLGSLLAGYTREELLAMLSATRWLGSTMKVGSAGPEIVLDALKPGNR
jgi:ubiquinone/menaquinone biosynthesis C-methylase UbiE